MCESMSAVCTYPWRRSEPACRPVLTPALRQVEVKLAEPREASKPVDGQPMQMTPADSWRPPQEPATAHWGMPAVPVSSTSLLHHSLHPALFAGNCSLVILVAAPVCRWKWFSRWISSARSSQWFSSVVDGVFIAA